MEVQTDKRFEDHMAADERSFDAIARALERLVSYQTELGEVKADVAWLKKFFWLVMTPVASALVLAVLALIFKK